MQAVDQGLIYDVGLHDGADSAYYLRNGYRVLGIDANPVQVEAARKRFSREYTEGRFVPLNLGIAEGEGTDTFWVSEQADWSSFDAAIAGRRTPPRPIQVPLCSFQSVLETYGLPLYCKIDIEGNDYLCLAAMRKDFRPLFVSVELTASEVNPRPLIEQLHELEYDRFKIIHQLSFTVPRPRWYLTRQVASVRSGKSICEQLNGMVRGHRWDRGWHFRVGSSGPLPRRLPGRWLTFAEASHLNAEIERLFRRGVLGAPDWFDVHATNRSTLEA
jgi:FkbM family methyltransferase